MLIARYRSSISQTRVIYVEIYDIIYLQGVLYLLYIDEKIGHIHNFTMMIKHPHFVSYMHLITNKYEKGFRQLPIKET